MINLTLGQQICGMRGETNMRQFTLDSWKWKSFKYYLLFIAFIGTKEIISDTNSLVSHIALKRPIGENI